MEFSNVIPNSIMASFLAGLPSTLFGIASYILTAYALYTLAKNRGINNPWLAWIPVADSWILGSLSDQYRYVTRGEFRARRKGLLILNILTMLLGTAMTTIAVGVAARAFFGIVNGYDMESVVRNLISPSLGLLGLIVPLIGLAIAKVVLTFMALYDVYHSCDPENCVLFLVLSILVGVTKPFFLFCNRNKEMGMPPRRSAVNYQSEM